MTLDRRNLLTGAGLAGLCATATATAAAARTRGDAPDPLRHLIAEAPSQRMAVAFDGTTWSGPGWDHLLDAGRASQFLLLGEEHGLVEVPALVRQLMPALGTAGYSRLALEVSPPGARALDVAAQEGVPGLRRFYADHPPGPAFYTMDEEARMLAAVRGGFPANSPLLLGLDYEVLIDRYLIDQLKIRVPASAGAALTALDAASKASWARFEATRDVRWYFCFSGDPALVRAVRAVWPDPDPLSEEILETLGRSLLSNQHQTAQRYFLSNDSRAQLTRANWVRFWRAETAAGRQPRILFKFGAGHMVRGRSMTEVYDIGNMVAETAALMGGRSYHLLVVPLDGGRQAAFNPATFGYEPRPVETIAEMGLEPLAALAFPDSATLFNLEALRPRLPASLTRTADPRLARVVHGYDAVLLVPGATASGRLEA